MKQLILLAALTLAATAVMAEKIGVFNATVRTPGVNIGANLMYVKTDLPCAYEGRLAFPATFVGAKAWEEARDYAREELEENQVIPRLVYTEGKLVDGLPVCTAENVRD